MSSTLTANFTYLKTVFSKAPIQFAALGISLILIENTFQICFDLFLCDF